MTQKKNQKKFPYLDPHSAEIPALWSADDIDSDDDDDDDNGDDYNHYDDDG